MSNGNCSLLHCVRSICLHNSSLQILRTLRPKACTEGFASADMIGSIQRKVIPKDKKQEGGGANEDDLVLAQMALRPPGSVCFSTMNGNGMDWKRETGLTCLEKRGFAIWFFKDHAIYRRLAIYHRIYFFSSSGMRHPEMEQRTHLIRGEPGRRAPFCTHCWRIRRFTKQPVSQHFSKRLFANNLRTTATSRLQRESWAVAANQIRVSCLGTRLESLSF